MTNVLPPYPKFNRASAVAPTNYQAHQPPLLYALVGLSFRALPDLHPDLQLLFWRLLAAVACGLTIVLLIPILGRDVPGFELLFLIPLLLPGAAESLARAANDFAIFIWTTGVLVLVRQRAQRRVLLLLLLAVGPLLKLTALPICAFVVVSILRESGWLAAFCGGASSCIVFLVQLLRGWAWGGTLEATGARPLADGLGTIVIGVGHSAYTFVKTAVWLGGWTVTRPPTWLVVALFVSLLVVACFCRLRRAPTPHTLAHVAGLTLAVIGFVVFAIGKRKVFGVWGAVGGWYAWGWWPWIALAISDVFVVHKARSRNSIIALGLALAVLFHGAWVIAAWKAYT